MIKVKHPLDDCNTSQEKLLSQFSEGQKRFQELMFSYGNSAYLYHSRAREFEPSITDYSEWLEGLPENIRKDMEQKGFEGCKGVLSFTRYVNEKNDIGMEEFIKEQMGEEYQEYKNLINPE